MKGFGSALIAAFVAACAVTSSIQPADSGKSHFDDAVFKGTRTELAPRSADRTAYRIFIQGATGFVPMASVRDDAEQRAIAFCDRRAATMEALEEQATNPPYILGNFPKIEIIFDCVPKAQADVDPKFTRLSNLKKLLDTGAITQEEFETEKAKVLNHQ
jgi:hypothetical protein